MSDLLHQKRGKLGAKATLPTRTMLRLLGWSALATTILTACRTDAVPNVEAPGPLGPQLPTLELLQTVGCDACSGPDLFGRIVGVAAGPDNLFAVLTAEAPFVRVWNRIAGTAVQFGRQGGGPGEMQRAEGVILTPETTQVAAVTGIRKRIESFDAEGNHFESTPITLSRPYSVLDVFQGSPSGRWGVLRDRGSADSRVLRLGVGTGATVEIPRPPSLLEGAPTATNLAAANVSIAVSDDGTVAMGYGAVAYRLAIVPPGGGVPILGGRQIPQMERPPLTREQWETQQRELIAQLQRMNPNLSPEVAEQMGARQMPTGPRFVPHLSQTFDGALRFDRSGRLWARTPRGNSSGRTIFDVFDQDLTYLGEVVIPEGTTFWHIGADQMITAGVNDAEIPVVMVWRLR